VAGEGVVAVAAGAAAAAGATQAPSRAPNAVTGANASSGACTTDAAYGSGSGGTTLIVAISASGSPADLLFSAQLGTTANFATGTYTSANVVSSQAASASTTSGAAWAENFNNGSNPNQGTFTLTITSTGSEISAGSGDAWQGIHGSLNLTLPPDPNSTVATGTLTATATF